MISTPLQKVILQRLTDDGKQTTGKMILSGLICVTLELPWKNNKTAISCIPPGDYFCRWTRSNRMSSPENDVFTYEVLDVPFRYGIRIHSANYASQLLGCIALGSSLKDINRDLEPDTIDSRLTLVKFNLLLNQQDFQLSIT